MFGTYSFVAFSFTVTISGRWAQWCTAGRRQFHLQQAELAQQVQVWETNKKARDHEIQQRWQDLCKDEQYKVKP